MNTDDTDQKRPRTIYRGFTRMIAEQKDCQDRRKCQKSPKLETRNSRDEYQGTTLEVAEKLLASSVAEKLLAGSGWSRPFRPAVRSAQGTASAAEVIPRIENQVCNACRSRVKISGLQCVRENYLFFRER